MSLYLLDETFPKPRKDHVCSECERLIKHGVDESYVRQAIVDGGLFYVYKAHRECYEFALTVGMEEDVLAYDRQWALGQDPPPIVRERLERGPE